MKGKDLRRVQIHLPHPLIVRPETTDVAAFKQMFIEQHYELPLDILPEVLVDLGANVGYTSVYLALRYSRSRIIALEPEQSNFEILLENIRPYPTIAAFPLAVWSKNATLETVPAGLGA